MKAFKNKNISLYCEKGIILAAITRGGDNTITVYRPVGLTAVKGFSMKHGYDEVAPHLYEKDYNFERASIPYIVFPFYWNFAVSGEIPTFKALAEQYIEWFCTESADGTLSIKEEFESNAGSFRREALIGRIARAYASYLRELDLLLQLSQYADIEASYSFQDDLKGYDIVVESNSRLYGLATYWGSVASRHDRERKSGLHNTQHSIHKVEMPADASNTVCVNGIYLYSETYVSLIHRYLTDARH